MKFTHLQIVNFLTIGHADVNLADRGLVLVQGVNEDDGSANSNGSGKSSIADALAWVLFGVTARGVTGDAVVNKTAKKGTHVSVTIEDGATTYRIERFRKHAGGKNTLKVAAIGPGGTTNDLSKGTDRETQELVEKIVGCSYEVFRAAVYCGQEQMPDLPGMTDKQLKLLIEEAAGITRLEQAYAIAREKGLEASRKLTTIQAAHLAATSSAANAVARRDTVVNDAKQWTTDQATRVIAAKKHYEDRAAAFAAHAGKLKGFDKAGKLAARAKLKEGLDSYEKAQAALTTLRATVPAAVREVSVKEASVRSIAEKIKGHKEEIAAAVDGVGRLCKACGKPHTVEDRDALIRIHTDHMANLMPNLHAAKTAWNTAKASLAELEQKVRDAEAAIVKPGDALKAIADLDDEILRFDSGVAELRRLKSEVEAATAAVTTLKAQENPLARQLKLSEEAVIATAATLKEITEGIADATIEEQQAQAAIKVFGPAGVRAHILDTVTPFLNDRTAEYLATLSDGNITASWSTLAKTKAGELKERFCIDVVNSTGAESFAGLSGGEKRKVRLASMLALQDLVASRAVKPIDLFVADEVDDALDGGGLERLMVVMEKRARERGTVLMISHADLADWCDQVATVTKKGGYSTVEGALT